MKFSFRIMLFFTVLGLGLSAFSGYGHADKEKQDEEDHKDAKTAGYIIGKILNEGSDAFDDEPVYRGKKIFENDDIIIRRGYTKDGKEIKTITRK